MGIMWRENHRELAGWLAGYIQIKFKSQFGETGTAHRLATETSKIGYGQTRFVGWKP